MIGKDVVRKVAQVARLDLTDRELDEFSRDMASVLRAFRSLDKAPTKGVRPTFQPIECRDVTREDAVEPSLPQDEALANSRNKEEGCFRGPKVV